MKEICLITKTRTFTSIRHNTAEILREDREEFGSTGTCHRFVIHRLVDGFGADVHKCHRQVGD